MKEAASAAFDQFVQNKVAGTATATSGFMLGVVDQIDPTIRFLTMIAALLLSMVMIRAHWLNGNKAKLETELLRMGKRPVDRRNHDDEELDDAA